MIDVGQGDSTLIITPNNKKILIDGGGSPTYDVGKNTLIPYLLDRKIKKLDYVIISHFDEDHVGGILTVLKELTVEQIIISKQGENSEQFQQFIKIVEDRKIKVIVVKKRRWTNYWKRCENSDPMARRKTNTGKCFKNILVCYEISIVFKCSFKSRSCYCLCLGW